MQFLPVPAIPELVILDADESLNSDSAEALFPELERLVNIGIRRVVAECTNLEYVNSYGIGVLLRIHKRLEKLGGELRMAGLNARAAETVALARFDQVVAISGDVATACRSCACAANRVPPLRLTA